MTGASIIVVIAINQARREPALRTWYWLWVYLLLNAVLNLFTCLQQGLGLGNTGFVAHIGRIFYLPPLLLGLAEVVGNARYRRFAQIGAAVLATQLAVAWVASGMKLTTVPGVRTSIASLIVLAVAAPAILARLPRVRGSILRDPPTIALVAALLGYGSSLFFLQIYQYLPEGSGGRLQMLWARNAIWIICYGVWWHAFREARRQARPA
jgi:hypothetical protein